MKNTILYTIVLLFIGVGCNKDQDQVSSNGLIEELEPLWVNRGLLEQDNGFGIQGFLDFPHDGETVIYLGSKNGNGTIHALDIETGKQEWYQDMSPVYAGHLAISGNHVSEGKFYFGANGYGAYILDFEKRAIEEVNDSDITIPDIHTWGYENYLYFRYLNRESDKPIYCVGRRDFNSTDYSIEKVVCPPELPLDISFPRDIYCLINTTIAPFRLENGDEAFFLSWAYPTDENNYQISNNYFGLYNIDREELEFIEQTSFNSVHGLKAGFYHSNNYVYYSRHDSLGTYYFDCMDKYTLEVQWSKQLNTRKTSEVAVVEELGMVVFSTGHPPNIHALDMQTGDELWVNSDLENGQFSRYEIQNGVMYFVAGVGGYINAIDLETGKRLWKLRAPDGDETGHHGFKLEINGIAGESGNPGKIFVSSFYNGFCFEAIR